MHLHWLAPNIELQAARVAILQPADQRAAVWLPALPRPTCLLQNERKPSPLQRGGTLQGAAAAGKDASDKFKAAAVGVATTGPMLQVGPCHPA